ncbi:MAG TPA: helix-turn-helix domain-containing protein [Rectinemataceae bacterium]|nr:helix-turn-helix domain-containing protein [Rectinemataceae bacterium]
MLTEAAKKEVLAFLKKAGEGSISLRFCERFDEKSKIWNLKEHSHPYLELIYFIEGKASVATGTDTLDVALYDLLVYPPGVLHKETLDLSKHQEIICLWLELGSGATLPFPFKLGDDNGEFGWLFQSAHKNHIRRHERYLELEQHLLRSILLFIEQKLALASPSRSMALDRSRAYIDEHYAEEFDVETLARLAYVTPSYLSRLFKKHLATTPMRYRNYVRIEKAKHLLLIKSAAVEEVAEVVGFEDPKYFSHLFKTHTSLTPSEFRRKYRAP